MRAGQSYLIHSAGSSSPHCVGVRVSAGGVCRVFDGDEIHTLALSDLIRLSSQASDADSLVLFSVEVDHPSALGDAVEFLQLLAGGRGRRGATREGPRGRPGIDQFGNEVGGSQPPPPKTNRGPDSMERSACPVAAPSCAASSVGPRAPTRRKTGAKKSDSDDVDVPSPSRTPPDARLSLQRESEQPDAHDARAQCLDCRGPLVEPCLLDPPCIQHSRWGAMASDRRVQAHGCPSTMGASSSMGSSAAQGGPTRRKRVLSNNETDDIGAARPAQTARCSCRREAKGDLTTELQRI